MIAARLDRPRVHRRAHHRLRRRSARVGRALHARSTRATITGVPAAMIVRRRRDVGAGRDQLAAARPRHRAPLQGRRELPGGDQPGAGHRPDRHAGLRLRDDHRPGQRPGRARARPEVRPAARRSATSRIPQHREYIAGVWGVAEPTIPHAGLSARARSSKRSTTARSRGCCSICFNPLVSLPDARLHRARRSSKLEFFAVIDFFLSETARYADVVLPGSLQEEDEGTTTNVEGRVIHHRAGRSTPPGRRAPGLARSSATSRSGSAQATSSPTESPREIFEELRVASKGGVADYSGIT